MSRRKIAQSLESVTLILDSVHIRSGGGMKIAVYVVLSLVLVFGPSTSEARNEVLRFSIEEALAQQGADSRLDDSIRLFFGDQAVPAIERKLGTFTANKKTNGFNKSDMEACNWTFLAAMMSLQKRAAREGGNAVVNIQSFYRKSEFSSASEFECGAGTFVVGITMVGEVVKLAE